MFFRFSSLLSVAALLFVASEYNPTSNLLAQSRVACPAAVRTLTTAAQDPLGRTPALQLMAHLAERFQGTIVIPSQITVDMRSARNLWIGSCVTLSGTRGGLDPGAAIVTTDDTADGPVFSIVGQNVRIRGLRFRGPLTTDDRSPRETSIKAFEVRDAATAAIDNNLFEFWNVAVIVIRPLDGPSCRDVAPPVTITRNYFNRNANEDAGYGVGMREGCALIQGNLFNKNRHAVASSGPAGNRQSYLARFNYVLEGGFTVCNDLGLCHWNQHFDVHGSGDGGYGGEAGEYFEIVSNTIRGEQTYYLTQTRPAFMLRGKPALAAYFSHNVVVHDDSDEAVRLKDPGAQCLDYTPSGPTYSWERCNLHVELNRYDTDLINELAAGDFDGDGRDDVFLANGTGWWYSSAGLTEWRFLRASTVRARDLRFGNFTGDARTDVLYGPGTKWYVSSGGAGSPVLWREDGTALRDCVFGDFDGDGLTDALRADGSSWSIAANGRGPWTWRRNDWVRAADLRVADFTNDRVSDVFLLASNAWTLWDPARNVLTRDHRQSVSAADMPLLVVADFDGDGRADLARTDSDGWMWLRTGTTSWTRLRGIGEQAEYADIRAAVFGRFTAGDRAADAIRYASSRFTDASSHGFVIWNAAQEPFVPWSPLWQEMR